MQQTLLRFSLFALAAAVAVACKKSDNPPALPEISIADASRDEGQQDNFFSFSVTLDAPATAEVSVDYETADGTALAGQDFTAQATGKLVFAPGEVIKTIDIQVKGDVQQEPDEQFEVVLSNPSNATLGRSRAKGTIRNDDFNSNPLVIPATGYTSPVSYPGRTLVWQDEFDGTVLNPAYWTHEIGNGQNGWGNNELQYYRSENTSLVNGHLVIQARKENFSGFGYTSSRIISKDKKQVKFGRIDIRAVLPQGKGIWPALWMLGANIGAAGWPACGEIDIMELVGHEPNKVHGTAHYGANFSQHKYTGASYTLGGAAKFSDEFHVFSIEWEQDRIEWLVDDVPFFELTPTNTAGQPYPFNQDFFFIFNIAVGGNWPGSPEANTVFQQYMIVDYVRVFQ